MRSLTNSWLGNSEASRDDHSWIHVLAIENGDPMDHDCQPLDYGSNGS